MNKICIELENGKKMYVELYEDIAPLTVENFLNLIEKDFFKGIVFHRVIKDFMCQAGGYYIVENKYININIKNMRLCNRPRQLLVVSFHCPGFGLWHHQEQVDYLFHLNILHTFRGFPSTNMWVPIRFGVLI